MEKSKSCFCKPPDALTEEASVNTCWERCTAKQFGVGLGTAFALGFFSGGI